MRSAGKLFLTAQTADVAMKSGATGIISLWHERRDRIRYMMFAMKDQEPMTCRPGCGACCIALSISSLGKAAGVPCAHLTADMKCGIWGRPERPVVCASLQPRPDTCGTSREEAMQILSRLEILTTPDSYRRNRA